MAGLYQALGFTSSPGLAYSGRAFDASGSSGWGDGGGDTFDGWSGFHLTINSQTSALATMDMMNDASGLGRATSLLVGGVTVTVYSVWYQRDYFCIQCRYAGSAALSFGGGMGSDGAGVNTKTGLIGSHGGAGDPRVWWRIVPLIANDPVDQTISGSDPLNITTTPIQEGFALLFGWALVNHDAVLSTLALAVQSVDDVAPRWLNDSDPFFTRVGLLDIRPVRLTAAPANQEIRSQFQPQDVSWKSGSMWSGSVGDVPLIPVPANQETREQFQPQDIEWRGSPGFVVAGPVPKLAITQTPLCKGRDFFWIRDGVRNVEQGYIESTVTISGVGVRRRVLCFTQDGELVGETYSRASDGVYRFDLLWLNRRYMVVAQDDPAYGPADYNAVAADYQAPKPYAPGGGVAAAPFPMLATLKRN